MNKKDIINPEEETFIQWFQKSKPSIGKFIKEQTIGTAIILGIWFLIDFHINPDKYLPPTFRTMDQHVQSQPCVTYFGANDSGPKYVQYTYVSLIPLWTTFTTGKPSHKDTLEYIALKNYNRWHKPEKQ